MPKAGGVWKYILFVKLGKLEVWLPLVKYFSLKRTIILKQITMLSLNVIEWFIVITYRNLFFQEHHSVNRSQKLEYCISFCMKLKNSTPGMLLTLAINIIHHHSYITIFFEKNKIKILQMCVYLIPLH